MRAITFHGIGDVRATEIAEPRLLDPRDALVEVEAAAICGSDLHVYHGRERGLDPGSSMGHELVGTVVEVGADVALSPGTRVASPFSTSCGRCAYCVRGLTSRCERGALLGWVENGVGLGGAQAELVRVPLADTTLVPLARETPAELGILLTDVLPTGFHAVEQAGLAPGDVAVVLGAGPVGQCALLALEERGVRDVVVLDPVPERRELARRLGATALPPGPDAALRVREASAGRGADAVIEAVGSAEALRLAIDCLRPGGTLSAIGVHNEAAFAFSPAEAYAKSLTFRTGRAPARMYMERLVPWLSAHAARLAALVSHRLPLEEGPRGYRLFDEKREGCTKVLLLP
jgi:threonine dehydrogenase-like Zn-dependent dehydrogenase